MTTRPRLRSTMTLVLTLLFFVATGSQETHASTDDAWWDNDWPYRVVLHLDEAGAGKDTLNFSQLFIDFGLKNDALLDLWSLRVVPYINGIPGEPIPFEETFSQLIVDADELIVGTPPDHMDWRILEESTILDINNTLKTQGEGSLHAHIEISEDSQHKIGFYFDFKDSGLDDWSNNEILIYDVYPSVSEEVITTKPELFSFELAGLQNCPIKYINGPVMDMDSWNFVSVSLKPFGVCPSPDLSCIDSMKFFLERENFNYDEIDISLDFWLDNFRLFDQDADGQIIWNAEENVDMYYLYFDLLRYEDTKIYFPIVFR